MMVTGPEADHAVLIRIEYETAKGDSRAIRRRCDDRAPETVQKTLAMAPRGAIIETIHIRDCGGETGE